MQLEKKLAIHNRFDFEVRDAKTGRIKQRAYAENIILDALWSKVLSASPDYFAYIHLGTGTGSLLASRTALFTFLVAKVVGTATYTDDPGNHVVSARRSIQLSEIENVGAVFTEIGIASSATSSTLMTHAMIKDMNGNPITITKGDLDILTIYATVYAQYADGGWDSGKVQLLGSKTSNPLIIWALGGGSSALTSASFAFYCGTGIDTETDARYATYAYAAIPTTETVDAGNKRVTYYARLPVGSGNVAGMGIASIRLLPFGVPAVVWNLLNSTAHPGNTVTDELLGTGNGSIQDFATDFPFVKAGAVIKADGVEVLSGVTVTTGQPYRDLCPMCNAISAPYGLIPGTNHYDEYNREIMDNAIFENPYYSSYGVYSIWLTSGDCYA